MTALSLRGVLFLVNIRLFLLWILVSSMCLIYTTGTFILRKCEENEVIFVGEKITLECRAPSNVSSPQFRLLDSQNNVLVDQDYKFYADGHFGYSDSYEGGANFQIMINSVMQNRYLCEISGNDDESTIEEIGLNISPRTSPQCFLNTSASVTIGEVIGLSCYQEVGVVPNSGFRWRQILRDGTVNEQFQNTSNYSNLINSFKRKLSMNIIASLNDEGSEFECVIIDSGSQKTCKTGVISIHQLADVELSILPTNVYSLDKGESQVFSCESSDLRYNTYWERNLGYQHTDVEVELSAGSLTVRVPKNTTLLDGNVLCFVCAITFLGNVKSEKLLVTIAFASGLNPPDNTSMDITTNVFASTVKLSPTTTNIPITASTPASPPTNTSVSYQTLIMNNILTSDSHDKINTAVDNDSGSNINDAQNSTGTEFLTFYIMAAIFAMVLIVIIAIILIYICMMKQ